MGPKLTSPGREGKRLESEDTNCQQFGIDTDSLLLYFQNNGCWLHGFELIIIL